MKIRFRHFAKGPHSGRRGHVAASGLSRRAPSASVLDLAFSMSEQVVSKKILKKKMRPSNAFTGKVPDGEEFPMHVGTQLKMRRLTRSAVPNTGWEPVDDELCQTNTHLYRPDMLHHGSEDFLFSLVTKDLQTDPINLAALAHRAIPEEEVAHIEENCQNAALYVHESFRRDRYYLFTGHKYLATVPVVSGAPVENHVGTEADAINNGYVFEFRANGEMDEHHIRAAVAPTDITIRQIAELSLDLLDMATASLAYEGEPYMGDTQLFDTLVATPTMYKGFAREDNALMDGAASHSEVYNMIDLSQKYGTQHVIRNYAIRNDSYSPRFYPDVAFNTALAASDGYEFDLDDPLTWARFVRVYPYAEVKAARGTKWEKNLDYIRAPFGLSTLFQPRVMSVMSFPDVQAVGGAKIASEFGGFGYDGVAKWMNFVDRVHNPRGEIGHWSLRFKLAARPMYTEEGYSWFHRINGRVNFVGNAQAVPTMNPFVDITPFCTTQIGGTDNPNGPGAVETIES